MATMYSEEVRRAVVSRHDVKGEMAIVRLAAELELAGVPADERELFLGERVLEELKLGHLTRRRAAAMLRQYLEGGMARAFRLGIERGEFTDLLHTEVENMLGLVEEDHPLETARLRAAWEMRTA